jgi:multidrug efflux pump subunit AcrA (membrane-fusion protein)
MRAKGTLQPVVKSDIFAPMPGEVEEVLKTNGEQVAEGEPLLKMRNPELLIKVQEVHGQLASALENFSAIQHQLTQNRQRLTELEFSNLQGKFAEAQVTVKYLRDQHKLLQERYDRLTVRSPIAGKVITWDVKKLLQNRPVETGQVLMTVAAENTDYEVELYMPERRIGHLRRARDRVKESDPKADLAVDFILMTDPGVSHEGTVVHVNPTAEPHEEHGNMVRIRVEPADEIEIPRPGATVTADVHCGRAPFLWAKLHEAWEWLEANVLF